MQAALFGSSFMRKSTISLRFLSVDKVATTIIPGIVQQLPVTEKVKDFSKERKMSALELQHLKRKGKKISMITAYDYPTVPYIPLAVVPNKFEY